MPLRSGRQPWEVETSQAQGAGFSQFSGILGDDGFRRVSDAGSEIMGMQGGSPNSMQVQQVEPQELADKATEEPSDIAPNANLDEDSMAI